MSIVQPYLRLSEYGYDITRPMCLNEIVNILVYLIVIVKIAHYTVTPNFIAGKV